MDKIDELIGEGLELAIKHEMENEKYLNDPTIPQEIKNIRTSFGKTLIPAINSLMSPSDKKIKRINPETFEIEYE